ncbi:MAG: hypothetical protein A2428_03055 [Bdellovibrionales bacterium RIFOXYC1_FULL_54_43]|nr:MAG: hypothetical protein A2428_03055 [Bdellovibrionales bacterium RIFOXYC1_FULL_54_43]OFZ82660.1 MAG: hypothetical protein A2603_02490 [Bdellovibrionales bacterium RIFOXYD1_FULL_55_31]
MEKKKGKKLKYGKKDLLAGWEFDPNEAKVLISIRLDGDVLEAVKAAAAKAGKKYQPWINDVLREITIGANESPLLSAVHDQLKSIQKSVDEKIDAMARRLQELEALEKRRGAA